MSRKRGCAGGQAGPNNCWCAAPPRAMPRPSGVCGLGPGQAILGTSLGRSRGRGGERPEVRSLAPDIGVPPAPRWTSKRNLPQLISRRKKQRMSVAHRSVGRSVRASVVNRRSVANLPVGRSAGRPVVGPRACVGRSAGGSSVCARQSLGRTAASGTPSIKTSRRQCGPCSCISLTNLPSGSFRGVPKVARAAPQRRLSISGASPRHRPSVARTATDRT